MVVALDGWVDGGEASTGAAEFLRRKLRARKMAEMPVDPFHIYQVPGQLSLRPHSRVEDGLLKEYLPPRNVFSYWVNPLHEQDVVLFQGTEPNMNWPDYASALLEVAQEYDVARIYMLGGVLDKTPHTREPVVSCVCTSADVRDELSRYGIGTIDYEGPGGIRTALVSQCRRVGIEMAILHVRATYYPEFNVVIPHNPKAIRSLVRQLNALLRLGIDTSELDSQVQDYEGRLAHMTQQNHEFRSYIEELEKDYEETGFVDGPGLSAHDAIRAAEDFLRGSSPPDG